MKGYKTIKVNVTRTIQGTVNMNVPSDFDENDTNLMESMVKNKIYGNEYIIDSDVINIDCNKITDQVLY